MTLSAPLLGAVLCFASPVQEPAAPLSDPRAERVLGRFAVLPLEEQQRIVEEGYQAMLECGHPLANAARSLEAWMHREGPKEQPHEAERYYDAGLYAPALGLRSRLVERDTSSWERTRRHYLPQGVPDRAARWRYDFGRDLLLRPRERASARERIERLLRGDWPEPDRLRAVACAALDHDASTNGVADYFEHAYRDRDGRLFEGILLWDIWDSGRTFEISDVEAIAWLRLIAGEEDLRSPIPRRLHAPLYARMSDSFAAWREHRLLREALAGVYLTPGGPVPAVYSAIRGSLAEAWVLHEHDPGSMVATLQRCDSRQCFFEEVERLAAERGGEPSWRAGIDDRLTLAPLAREAVLQTMKVEGLLGLGRRF